MAPVNSDPGVDTAHVQNKKICHFWLHWPAPPTSTPARPVRGCDGHIFRIQLGSLIAETKDEVEYVFLDGLEESTKVPPPSHPPHCWWSVVPGGCCDLKKQWFLGCWFFFLTTVVRREVGCGDVLSERLLHKVCMWIFGKVWPSVLFLRLEVVQSVLLPTLACIFHARI